MKRPKGHPARKGGARAGRRRALIAACAVLLAPFAAAASQQPPPQPPQASPLLERGLAYLNGLREAEGRFTQTDPKGQTSHGRFYIERPGRARFEYEAPKSMLVVSNGDLVTVFDRRLKTQDQYPLEQTPLALLLANDIHLGKSIAASVAGEPGGFAVTLRDASPSAPGRLILRFSEAPLALRGWTVLDAQNGRTVVRLDSLERRSNLDPSLFQVGDLTQPPAP